MKTTTIVGVVLLLFVFAVFSNWTKQRNRRNRFGQQRATEPAGISGIQSEPKQRMKYRDKFRLMNNGEQELYKRLKEALPTALIFPQVSLSQVLHLESNPFLKRRQLNEIGRKSIDFLLCRTDTSIVLAIELNGPHHDTEERQRGDEKKRQALTNAGIPLVIYRPENIPTTDEIRKTVADCMRKRKQYEADRNRRLQRDSP